MKIKKILGAATIAASLGGAGILGLATPVFADIQTYDPTDSTSTPITAAITKKVATGTGTTIPELTYTFEFTQDTSGTTTVTDGTNSTVTSTKPVAIADKTVTVGPSSSKETVGDTDYYSAETADFLSGLTFTETGVYAYDITETASATKADSSAWANVTAANSTETSETLIFSQATYRMNIYVKEASDGTKYIYAVTTTMTTDDQGNSVPAAEQTKVDPTPGGDPNVDGDLSDLAFTNSYKKVRGTGGDNPDPDPDPNKLAPLTVSKTVAGDYGDKSKQFTFEVKITRNAAFPTDTAYNAWIYTTTDGTTWTKGAQKTFTFNNEGYAELDDIQLTHNQKLVFSDIPVGTRFKVVENDYSGDGYTTTINGATPSVARTEEATAAEAGSVANYVNTNNGTTPTGILTNGLPYFIIIGGGVAALIIGVAVKASRRKNDPVQ